jgi:hypothetical protein
MTRNLYEAINGEVTFGSAFVGHDAVDVVFDEAGLTDQSFADECDLNKLMARYQKTGLLPQHPGKDAFYGDFADLPSFQEAQHIIAEASSAFMLLPATVRAEFENDPGQFVAFAQDEANLPQMREWGLAKPLDEAPPPVGAAAVTPPDPTPAPPQGAPTVSSS